MESLSGCIFSFFVGSLFGGLLSYLTVKHPYIFSIKPKILDIGYDFTKQELKQKLSKNRARIYGKSKSLEFWIIKKGPSIKILLGQTTSAGEKYLLGKGSVENFLRQYEVIAGSKIRAISHALQSLTKRGEIVQEKFLSREKALKALKF